MYVLHKDSRVCSFLVVKTETARIYVAIGDASLLNSLHSFKSLANRNDGDRQILLPHNCGRLTHIR